MDQGKERKHRDIGEDPDWNFLTRSHERRETGTAYLAPRAKDPCTKMKLQLRSMNDEMIVKTHEAASKTRTAKGVRCFQTENVIRPDTTLKALKSPITI
jgi:hypothetical protein